MTLSYIFSQKFLFDPKPSYHSMFYLEFIIIFALFIIAPLLLKFVIKTDKKIREKQFYPYFSVGILGYIYLGSRYESLPWLGSRLFLVLILGFALCWLIYVGVFLIRYVPASKNHKETTDKFAKYLPKKSRG